MTSNKNKNWRNLFGSSSPHKRKKLGGTIFSALMALVLVGFLSVAAFFAVAKFTTAKILTKDMAPMASSQFFDAKGNQVGQSAMNQVQVRRMNTVQLTIDARMQFILEKSLDEAIKKTHAASAAAILMDPNTGEILGMASRPTFDPNHFAQAPKGAYMNRGVGIVYEPGSVFKPIMGSAGLMEGVITPNTPFNDQGSIDCLLYTSPSPRD